jgi:ketosteroid isomerase-like protein
VTPDSAARDSAAYQAHANYVRVINSNNTDSLVSMLTDDVIYRTRWEKPVREFVISGDYAFERYDYTSTDTPVAGGKPVVDAGWGFVVYHRDADGVWRVARDAFGPDHPPAPK